MLKEIEVLTQLLDLIRPLYESNEMLWNMWWQISDFSYRTWNDTGIQPVTTIVFNIYGEYIIRQVLEYCKSKVTIREGKISDFRYDDDDDSVFIAVNEEEVAALM